ncbi:hypothetical protein SDC9_201123 [bioreactor metagenome]|uniref:Uncharacterized protein n=1 Tax=bioreactor metagenome TaxID=1076179 RepID=A0A645ISU5_9ZZZZ
MLTIAVGADHRLARKVPGDVLEPGTQCLAFTSVDPVMDDGATETFGCGEPVGVALARAVVHDDDLLTGQVGQEGQ